jgi:hypothetical protein
MARQLKRFELHQRISAEVTAQFQQAIRAERDRLLGKESALNPATPAPVAERPPVEIPQPPMVSAPIPLLEPVEQPVLQKPAEPAAATLASAEAYSAPPIVPEPITAVSLPAEAPVVEAPPPPRPLRRSWAELLTAFMEQRNILWGELLGGLLIVGCSIMLVIYLWRTHEGNLLYQFGIFIGVTAALFGAGLYTLSHWKLETTSRGLLIIATLLVPLNFLAMAAQAKGEGGMLEIVVEMVAAGLFAALLPWVARVLVPEQRWFFALGVFVPSVSQVFVPRLLGDTPSDAGWPLVLTGCLPLGGYLIGVGGGVLRSRRNRPLHLPQVQSLFTLMGIPFFALSIAFGLLVYWNLRQGSDPGLALSHLAVLVTLAGVPLIAGGLMVQRDQVAEEESGILRTAGTGVVMLGMLIMAGAAVLAWPFPIRLLAVCGFNFLALTFMAFRWRLPVAHALALPCLVVSTLTTFHLVQDHIDYEQLWSSMLTWAASAESGYALAGLALLLAIAAEGMVRAARRVDGLFYSVGCGAVVILSLALLSFPWRAIEHPWPAFLLVGAYGTGALIVNARWRQPVLSSVGLGLLIVATLLALWWPTSPSGWRQPEGVPSSWGLVLAAEALVMVLAGLWLTKGGYEGGASSFHGTSYAEPLIRTAEGTTLLALLASAWSAMTTENWALPTAQFAYTLILVAATAFLLAWAYQSVALSWVGSLFILGGIIDALYRHAPGLAFPTPLMDIALLAHATLGLLISWALRRWAARHPSPLSAPLTHFYQVPLGQAGLVASCLALPLLLVVSAGQLRTPAFGLYWLAVLWIAVAWVKRWPAWFTAGQVVLSIAVLFSTTVWLEGMSWFGQEPFAGMLSYWDPRSLLAYGIGLGLYSLFWMLARLGLRSPILNRNLLEAPWASFDRLVLLLVVVAQAALMVVLLVPCLGSELFAFAEPVLVPSSMPTVTSAGWMLLALTAGVLVLGLWEKRASLTAAALVALALVACFLAAWSQVEGDGGAVWLRWGLAICFLSVSLAIWLRSSLDRLAFSLGWKLNPNFNLPRAARLLLLSGALVPVLVLTAADAVVRFAGGNPGHAVEESIFSRIGWLAGDLVPLIILSVGLIGHALRDRSPVYAFGAGLMVDSIVMGGYALAHLGGWTIPVGVQVLQLGTLAAALWTIAWLVVRIFWRFSQPVSPTARPLLEAQQGLPAAGIAALLSLALGLLVFFYPVSMAWSREAGSLLGWLAFAATGLAIGYRFLQEEQGVNIPLVGWFGLALLGLAACTVERLAPGWGYRTLLLAWAAYPLAWVVLLWRLNPRPESATESSLLAGLSATAAFWVQLSGLLAVFLSLKAAFFHDDQLWAAGALALVSPALAAMAIRLHREAWAFAAGLGVNLAASLVVWHFHAIAGFLFGDWWVLLIQANLSAGAAVALLWLFLRERLYGQSELTIRSSPLLASQTAWLVVGNALLGLLPVGLLFFFPDQGLPAMLLPVGNAWGRLALVLTLASAAWYLSQVAPERVAHVAGGLALGVGGLLACTLATAQGPNWLAFHFGTAAWALAGLTLLAGGWVLDRGPGKEEKINDPSDATHWDWVLARATSWLSMPVVQGWVMVLGGLVVLFAGRATWTDPQRPYWSTAYTLAACLMAGGLALWRREVIFVYASGLLVNVAGAIMWVAWGDQTVTSFGLVQALCLALGAVFWSALALAWPGPRVRETPQQIPAYTQTAAALGLAVVGLLIALAVIETLQGILPALDQRLAWSALIALAVALTLSLWDPKAKEALLELYLLGLAAVALALTQTHTLPRDFLWLAGNSLAFFVLLVSLIFWSAPHWSRWWDRLHLSRSADSTLEIWLIPAQVSLTLVGAGLSLWMVLDFPDAASRWGGPVTLVLLGLASVLLAQRSVSWPFPLRYGSLLMAVALLIETGWAILDPAGRDIVWLWLHRDVWMLVSVAVMTLAYGVFLARRLPSASGWALCCRRLGPWLGLAWMLVLAVILIEEVWLYEGDRTVSKLLATMLKIPAPAEASAAALPPMAPLAIGIVGLALIGLMAAGLAFAVIPGQDPLGLSLRGRKSYVYSAEVLLVLLFVHFRITLPWLFRPGFFAQYWPFIFMTIAFAGAGLSEIFRRQQIPVLAEPLERTGVFLPMLPVLAFWVLPEGDYALLWFLAGLLYGLLSVFKRSFVFALLAALAANMGLWVLLHLHQFFFLEHPQLWLIPIAGIGLAAEYINRDGLAPAQAAGLRYLCLIVIYVSSTADMFIARLDQSILPPLILASLSILGVLAGMLLRVRAFLFLGVTFLLFDILTIIWHAGIHLQQTWILWSFGIVVGVALLVLFGIFEKRRNDVLHLVDELKQWR